MNSRFLRGAFFIPLITLFCILQSTSCLCGKPKSDNVDEDEDDTDSDDDEDAPSWTWKDSLYSKYLRKNGKAYLIVRKQNAEQFLLRKEDGPLGPSENRSGKYECKQLDKELNRGGVEYLCWSDKQVKKGRDVSFWVNCGGFFWKTCTAYNKNAIMACLNLRRTGGDRRPWKNYGTEGCISGHYGSRYSGLARSRKALSRKLILKQARYSQTWRRLRYGGETYTWRLGRAPLRVVATLNMCIEKKDAVIAFSANKLGAVARLPRTTKKKLKQMSPGCALDIAYRISQFKSNKGWSDSENRNIWDGKLSIGIPREMAEAALGIPHGQKTTVSEDGDVEEVIFQYMDGSNKKRITLHFSGKTLSKWVED